MLVHWIWLATRDMKDREKLAVLEHFHTPEDAYFAREAALGHIPKASKNMMDTLLDKNLHPAEDILAECTRQNLQILTFADPGYPNKLKNIYDPPLVLYYKGQLPDFDSNPVIGVVGTRRASMYGLTTAKRMGYQIGRCGGILVSGLAKGIDAMAMQGALIAGQPVVGVLGCGADVVYPPVNRGLFADTERCGCILSEFVPGTEPYKWNFPQRNRIISGLSDGVLVVEAPQRSGALITARQALEQGRDLFVVPGNVGVASCEGSNGLLRDGMAVGSGWDVVGEYQARYPDRVQRFDGTLQTGEEPVQELKVAQKPAVPKKNRTKPAKSDKKPIDNPAPASYSDGDKKRPKLDETQQKLVDILEKGEQSVDDVIAASQLPTARVLSSLTILEVMGLVKRLPGHRIILK